MIFSLLDNPPLPLIVTNLSFLAFILSYVGIQKSVSVTDYSPITHHSEPPKCNFLILQSAFGGIFAGICLFAIPEWMIHYFFLHGLKLRLAGWNFHMEHHQFPEKLPKVPHSIAQHYLWALCLLVLYSLCSDSASGYFLVAGNILGLLLHEVAHLHAHGHPFLTKRLKFLEPCRRYHRYHHYSCEGHKVAFGLITPWMDLLSGHLPPDPAVSPFHVHSKQCKSSLSRRLVHSLMRLPLPLPYLHWFCMYYLAQDGDF